MFIRKRNANLSLERAVYRPAVKDAQGTILTHPVRTTDYIGSVRSYSRFVSVPGDLLEKLSDEEKAELQAALKENEPRPDLWLSQLAFVIRRAAGEIKSCVDCIGGSEGSKKKELEVTMKAVDDAWVHFFKTAQEHGLKRKARRPSKTLPSPDKGNSASHT